MTLPLLRPGLFAGGTIVLIWSFTELGTPLMFDYYRVTPVQIFAQIGQVNGNAGPVRADGGDARSAAPPCTSSGSSCSAGGTTRP